MSERPIRLIIVEDEPAHAEAIRRAFDAGGRKVDLRVAGSLSEFRKAIETDVPDLVLLDCLLPDGRGESLLASPSEAGALPFVLMTSHGDEEVAVAAMKTGALDYVVKSPETFAAMPQIVDGALRKWNLLMERRRAEEQLRALSLRQEAILDAVPDIIMQVDRNKVYTWASPAGLEFFGDDVVGKEAAFYFEGCQDTYGVVQPIFSGDEKVVYVESWQRRKDGQCRLLAWWCRTLKDADGNVTGALSSAHDITERHRVLETLHESEAKFRAIASHTPDHIIMQDRDLRYISVINPQLGLTEADMLGKTDKDILHPDDALKLTAIKRKVIETGESVRMETSLRSLKGKEEFFEGAFVPRFDSNGRTDGLIGYFRNVTERRRAEEELRKSREFVKFTMDSLPSHVCVIGEDGKILSVNKAWNDFAAANPPITGNVGEGANYLAVCDAATGPDAEIARKCAAGIRAVIAGVRPAFEMEYPCHSPQEQRWFVAHATRFGGINGHRAVITHVNITEQKEMLELLRASETRYRELVENLQLGVALIDRNYRIVMANSALGRLYRKTPESLVGQECFVGFGKDDRVCPPCPGTRAMATGEPARVEMEELREDGSRFFLRVQAFPIRGADGKPDGFIKVVEDVTEQKMLGEQYRQAQKMEAIGQLAGGVAHDIRNQLTVIRYEAEAMLQAPLAEEDRKDALANILKAVDRSASTTGQLLTFARKDAIQPRIVSPDEQVATLGKSLHGIIGEDIHLSVNMGFRPGNVSVDPALLQQALINLVINARDAMPRGGKLTLETDTVAVSARDLRNHLEAKPGRYATISVIDTGCGMTDEVRLHAFDPFFTTKEVGEGTGLGLPMVYGFAAQSGGFLDLQSAPGKGTTVRIFLPLVDEPVAPDATGPEREAIPKGTETLLVVEDEEPIRKLLAHQMQALGYTVLTASGSKEALSKLKEHGGRVDLLVTDIVMPEGSGVELAERVDAMRPGTRVLYISGYAGDELKRRGVPYAKINLLEKPFTIKQLAENIRKALAGGDKRTRE